ncbi:hypothetical protein DFH11DRAFT_197393 [Phellopilus nigrolimitatus]|nr:hypothetical protein DFH11DRAFT_197393 [Phellopilus nigrolimitatus]
MANVTFFSFSEAAQLFSAGASTTPSLSRAAICLATFTSSMRGRSTRRTSSRSTLPSQSKGDCARHVRKRKPPLSRRSWDNRHLSSSVCWHSTPRTSARARQRVCLARGHHLGREGGHHAIRPPRCAAPAFFHFAQLCFSQVQRARQCCRCCRAHDRAQRCHHVARRCVTAHHRRVAVDNDYVEDRPVFCALFPLFRTQPGVLIRYIDQLLPVFSHVFDPNWPDRLGDETRAGLLNLVGALNAENSLKVRAPAITAFATHP